MLTVIAKSRLGLLNIPFGGSGDNNTGVEFGGHEISNALGEKVIDSLVLDFEEPEAIISQLKVTEGAKITAYNKILAELYQQGAEKVSSALERVAKRANYFGPMLITLGGDHSVSFMSLQAVLKLKGAEAVRMLQIDSHTDIHAANSSPSGNFHGIWVRPFIAESGIADIDKQIPEKLSAAQLMYIGNLNCEPAETDFLDQRGIKRIAQKDIVSSSQDISSYIGNANHLHLSIDVDAFSERIAPATGIPAGEGLLLEDVEQIFAQVKKHPSYSIDLVEYNPLKDPSGITLELCLKIIAQLI